MCSFIQIVYECLCTLKYQGKHQKDISLNIFVIYNYYAFQLNFAQLIYIF